MKTTTEKTDLTEGQALLKIKEIIKGTKALHEVGMIQKKMTEILRVKNKELLMHSNIPKTTLIEEKMKELKYLVEGIMREALGFNPNNNE